MLLPVCWVAGVCVCVYVCVCVCVCVCVHQHVHTRVCIMHINNLHSLHANMYIYTYADAIPYLGMGYHAYITMHMYL